MLTIPYAIPQPPLLHDESPTQLVPKSVLTEVQLTPSVEVHM